MIEKCSLLCYFCCMTEVKVVFFRRAVVIKFFFQGIRVGVVGVALILNESFSVSLRIHW